MMMTTTLVNLKCVSTDPRAVKAAAEFPARLHAVHEGRIVLRESVVYLSNKKPLDVACTVCGHKWSTTADRLLQGRGCPGCRRLKNINSAGKRRQPRATPEEKQRAAELRAQGLSSTQIAKELGRDTKTIRCWLDPEVAEKHRQSCAKWKEENRGQHNANSRRYQKEFPHGKAAHRAQSANRRLLETNTPWQVFLDNAWHEVGRKHTYKVFNDALLPVMEREAIKKLYLEAQRLTEETGVEHHVDHIQPLSQGGEHLLYNLQILPGSENCSKGADFRHEDQEELCRRFFNSNHEQED